MNEETPPGIGGASEIPGWNDRSSTKSKPKAQRESFAVNIIAGLWRGVDVAVSPPRSGYSVRHFGDHAEARAFAEELSRVTGWPLLDRVGADG